MPVLAQPQFLPHSLGQPRGGCWPSTHGATTLDSLGGLDGVVQARSPQVDVLVGREGGKQVQQAFGVHVVVIIHVAEPSAGGGRGLCTEGPPFAWEPPARSALGSLTGELLTSVRIL